MNLSASLTYSKTAMRYFHLKKTMMQLFGDFKHLFITFIKYLVPISIINTYNSNYQQSITMTQTQLNP